jgi:ATP-dependent DNA helicase RecG
MAFEITEITRAQAEKVINFEEGQFGDVKAVEKRPADLSEDVSAFANSDGGELFIGVDELKVNGIKTRSWRGFADPEAANGFTQLFANIFPVGSGFEYEFLRCAGLPGLVLHATINKSVGITLASNRIPYVRRNAQSLPVTSADALRRLELTKGVHSFENDTANVSLDVITTSAIMQVFVPHVVPQTPPEDFLKRNLLIRDTRPTVAAVLLFADEPQAILPKHCGIKVYRFKTTADEGFRDAEAFIPITVEGCLYRQIRAAVEQTTNIIQQIPKMGEGSQFEAVHYPPKTLHEIIANAVIHRDYSLTDDIHIRIFDNRIEVQSPGKLAANMTVKNLTTQRAARNGAIQRLLNKFPDPPNRDVGEGIKTAIEAMTALGLEKPTFKETDNGFLVTIKHEKLATAELAIMDYLEQNETINNKRARKITFIQEDWRIKAIFGEMEKKKMIKRIGATAGTRYRKWQAGDDPEPNLFPTEPEQHS